MKHINRVLLLTCFISPLALADVAPVMSITPVSQNGEAQMQVQAAPLDVNQRVAVLERQMAAMNQIGLLTQVNNLQQEVQNLQGQVQVLTHTDQTLQAQSTSQYADLDNRLQERGGLKPLVPVPVVAPVPLDKSASAPADSDQDLYEKAYANIQQQNSPKAITGLNTYLTQYPTGQYAANAHYWLGQLYVTKGDSVSVGKAVTEFQTVINQYPQSDKIKDASLKLGYAYLLQNKNIDAKAQFQKVMKDYPGSSAAQLAETRLAQLP